VLARLSVLVGAVPTVVRLSLTIGIDPGLSGAVGAFRLVDGRDEREFWAAELQAWRAAAAKRPERLTPILPERWPPHFNGEVQLQCWESRAYLVQHYQALPFNGIPCTRLSICRYPVVKAGQWEGGYLWEDPFSWAELQSVKQEVLGDVFALEVYPPLEDSVNLANTRHLWVFAEPLALGWSQHRPTNGGNPTLEGTA
jgi:hypothetical protein